MDGVPESTGRTGGDLSRSWRLSRAALSFTIDQAAHGLTGLNAIDALLVMAINQANIVLLTHDPGARRAYGGLETPAPDESRRPVSVNAIATSLALPFETVRRHIGRLEAAGVCRHAGRGVIVPAAYLNSEAYRQDVMGAHARLARLYQDLSAADLLEPLPPSAFALSVDPPIRAAARLLSDFLLRTADILTRQTQDIASGLALAAVMIASPPLATPPQTRAGAPGLTIAAIARTLGMPPETARRRLARLVADGICARGARSRHFVLARPDDPAWDSMAVDLAAALQRLMAGLAERGVIDSWRGVAQAPADTRLGASRRLASATE